MINGLNHSFSPNYNCILLENFKLLHIHKSLSIRKDFGIGFKLISNSILIRKFQNVSMYYI
ncbi:hypothetical protein [Leptospira kirschneri]|uniref:hypothetical protein n=1 Tax=Leptospira kirschneri TaxID=29507 RepID=UPI0002F25E0D|nr:hypothetical protein [Leptospira kirschneri]